MPPHLVYQLVTKYTEFKKTDFLLDYGSGDGMILNQLAYHYGLHGIGVDRLPGRILLAKQVSEKFSLHNQFYDIEFDKLVIQETFDKILCLDVLEHIEHPNSELKKLSTLLRNGGQLIIQTPRGADKKYILKHEYFAYGEDKHISTGFEITSLIQTLNELGLKITYWQPDFTFISQIIYEVLETVRKKSEVIHSLIWPILYPICLIDASYNEKMRFSNGIFLIATKSIFLSEES